MFVCSLGEKAFLEKKIENFYTAKPASLYHSLKDTEPV